MIDLDSLSEQAIDSLLPHKAPMSLLTCADFADDTSVQTQCCIGEQCRLFMDEHNRVGGWLVLELMAQTIGVFAGVRSIREGGAPRIGFLLGTRKFDVSVPFFQQGQTLVIHARCLYYSDGVLPSQFECTASLQGTEISRANLTVFQPNQAPL